LRIKARVPHVPRWRARFQESGLLEEKEELMPSEYLSGKQHGHNTGVRAVKEFMSNMDKK